MYRMEEGDSLAAEIWVVLHGWDHGHRKVVLESDSTTDAVSLITEAINAEHHGNDAVMETRCWNICKYL